MIVHFHPARVKFEGGHSLTGWNIFIFSPVDAVTWLKKWKQCWKIQLWHIEMADKKRTVAEKRTQIQN